MHPPPVMRETSLGAAVPPIDFLAQHLQVDPEAVALCREADFIDLHLDTFIPVRLWGYDIFRHHGRGPFGRHFFGHFDLPRMRAAGLSGGMWSITTNPARTAQGRWRTYLKNMRHMERLVASSAGQLAFAHDVADYRRIAAAGGHAVLLSVQGGNAFTAADWTLLPPGRLTRVTLVHLTNSQEGTTSSPASRLRRHKGLGPAGPRLIAALNAQRCFVDLAHIHPDGFWEALDLHDPALPPIVTHTGVDGVHPHWRNLSDAQIRAISERGGVVGVMFHEDFLRGQGLDADATLVVRHLEHIIEVGGPQCAALGSDYDGAIRPPAPLGSGEAYPRLVHALLKRGHSEAMIRGILGANFLQSWARLRPVDGPS